MHSVCKNHWQKWCEQKIKDTQTPGERERERELEKMKDTTLASTVPESWYCFRRARAHTYIYISTTNHDEAEKKKRENRLNRNRPTKKKNEAKFKKKYDIRISSYFNEHVTLSLSTFIVHTYFIYLTSFLPFHRSAGCFCLHTFCAFQSIFIINELNFNV